MTDIIPDIIQGQNHMNRFNINLPWQGETTTLQIAMVDKTQ